MPAGECRPRRAGDPRARSLPREAPPGCPVPARRPDTGCGMQGGGPAGPALGHPPASAAGAERDPLPVPATREPLNCAGEMVPVPRCKVHPRGRCGKKRSFPCSGQNKTCGQALDPKVEDLLSVWGVWVGVGEVGARCWKAEIWSSALLGGGCSLS